MIGEKESWPEMGIEKPACRTEAVRSSNRPGKPVYCFRIADKP